MASASEAYVTGTAGDTPVPETLCDVQALIADSSQSPTGVLWRLAESGRQLDANLVHLDANSGVDRHAEPDLDVLLVVVDGTGSLTAENGISPLTTGAMMWLPRGSARSIAAGGHGLSYLTVHTRRPGMRIRPRPDTLPPPPPPRTHEAHGPD